MLQAVAEPSRRTYLKRKAETSAESDLRNLKTAQEVLMGDHFTYGATRLGTMPGSGSGVGDMLSGPLNASDNDKAGALVSGVGRDGAKVSVGLGVGEGVSLWAATIAQGADVKAVTAGEAREYYALSKHKDGARVFLTYGSTTAIFVCENEAWKGQPGIPNEATVSLFATGLPQGGGTTPCGGSPDAFWRPL